MKNKKLSLNILMRSNTPKNELFGKKFKLAFIIKKEQAYKRTM